MQSSIAKDTVNSSAKRSTKFNADFSHADDMGNDTLLTEVENSEVFEGNHLVNGENGDATETHLADRIDLAKKSDMIDAATVASLTPRLENQ
jgi:hypothetical protein